MPDKPTSEEVREALMKEHPAAYALIGIMAITLPLWLVIGAVPILIVYGLIFAKCVDAIGG